MPYNQGMMDNEENVGNRLPLIPMSLGWYFTSDMKSSNGFNRALGVIPFIKLMFVSLGALSEDTLKVMWNGNHETFRIFYVPDNGGSWIAVGPEIA